MPSPRIKASRDKPENQRDRPHRKIPHARPDDGVSSPGRLRLAVRLNASELRKTARTLLTNGESDTSRMVQFELRRPHHPERNPQTAQGCGDLSAINSDLPCIACSFLLLLRRGMR